ncbi:uncharacterized protein TM35_000041870 [Trypanosoma theileri]|uniref:Protein OS9-like domain-containing protein n=1 Tax=Trypanosoma theileri TaxID=67003 RepID=A0A1X0P5P7_9TRYP|nr:uncharacterized protein TM35_000041870 [Trypanosoma theileri]ORC91973.1 hypothetical protein TM35_000041870 [Trypanosoma theileri]
MRHGSIAAALLVVSVLLVCVTAEECEVARRMREHEVAVFKQFYATTGDPSSSTGSRVTSPSTSIDGSRSSSNSNSVSSGTPRRGCIGWQMRYWNYELCPGRWVRQYREVGGVIVEEFILGVQDRWHLMDEVGLQPLLYENGHQTMPRRLQAAGTAMDAAAAAPYRCVKEERGVPTRQVDVVYGAGTLCELGFQRSTTLHLICDETASIPHIQFTEPFVCNYDITVVSAAICDAMDGRVHSRRELSDADIIFAL